MPELNQTKPGQPYVIILLFLYTFSLCLNLNLKII